MTEHAMRELAADFALGALTDEEREAFTAHLAACEECQAEVRAHTEVVLLLGFGAPDMAPPPQLRDRVLSSAAGVRPIAVAGRGRLLPSWFATAAAVALAAGATTWAVLATRRAEHTAGELATVTGRLTAIESTTAALLGPRVHVVSLAAPGSPPAARVFWNHDRNVFVVTAFTLQPAPSGRTYQLWAITESRTVLSMGTFNTGPDGRVTTILPVGSDITPLGYILQCGLTEEPAGGSPQPTEAPRLLGTWSHSD